MNIVVRSAGKALPVCKAGNFTAVPDLSKFRIVYLETYKTSESVTGRDLLFLSCLYCAQNHRVSDLYPSSGIPNTRKPNVSQTESVSIHKGGRYLICWTRQTEQTSVNIHSPSVMVFKALQTYYRSTPQQNGLRTRGAKREVQPRVDRPHRYNCTGVQCVAFLIVLRALKSTLLQTLMEIVRS